MAGVYISWPFCAQKCTYCNFESGVFPLELEAEYLEALCAELASTAWPWTPGTVYLGGGTPSSMEPRALQRILRAVPGRPWQEATLETAPGALQRENVEAWHALGINRVSLGVQSFIEDELRRTGRKHTAEDVERDVELLRSCGIDEISIDLIAGLPAQTRASWSESLRWIEKLKPPHVSIYMFEIDEDSRLGQEMLLGGVRYGAQLTPDEETTVALYEEAVDRLNAAGLRRYEISNFALPGHESRHNLKYWKLEPYLGFGADAHSFDGLLRWQNSESVVDYVARWKSGAVARVAETPAVACEERFFVGLRLMEGVEPTPAERLLHAEPISRMVQAGLLEATGAKLRLTRRGVLLSNEVFQEFLAPPCPVN